MPFSAFGQSSAENLEPKVTSDDPNERKLARRLRILRRQEAAKKRQIIVTKNEEEEEDGGGGVVSKSVLETQVSICSNNMYDAVDEGIEASDEVVITTKALTKSKKKAVNKVTNIQVAGHAFEVQRREEEAAIRNVRMKHLEAEAQIAKEKFDAINAKWEKISKHNDPLDLYEETVKQKEKCKELLALKDAVIQKLQEELKAADIKFLKDQERQSAEINLLVQRINEQIKIMKRVLRTQLGIIEDAIDTERNDLIESFNRKWEGSNRQREKEQVNNLEKKLTALEEHHQEMSKIMISHQEKYREAKISLEKDIQLLQQELETMKAICLLNKEKVDYNYQVLKKRDEENLLIKSQQKRRINKLQDISTTLRRQINEMTENSRSEIKRLRAEVVNLYQKITDIEKKSKHFVSVNEVKFNQVWKFNTERANQLLRKIMAMDRVIYEQILGLDWTLPDEYHKYLSDGKHEEKDEDMVIDRKLSLGDEPKERPVRDSLKQRQQLLVHHLLSVVADSTGFLVEDRLQELLVPYTKSQKTLVYLDNIFSALEVKNLQDIEILTGILDPYIDCLTCARRMASAAALVEGREHQAVLLPTEISSDSSLTRKAKRDSGILAHLSDMVSQHKIMVHHVVSNITAQHRPSDFRLITETEDDSTSFEDYISDEGDDNISDIVESQGGSTKILLNLKSEDDVKIDHVFIKAFDNQHIQSDQPQDIPSEEQKENLTISSAKDETKRETIYRKINCRNPGHSLTVEPVLVLKALRDFVAEINEKEKSEIPLTLIEKLSLDHHLYEHKFSKDEVSTFWDGYKTTFATKQEKLWDALLLGLHKYHEILQNRHVLNLEIQQLKTQNHDLRRLLQHYTIPSYVKHETSLVEDNEFLPPILAEEQDSVATVDVEPVQLRFSQFFP